MAKANNVRTSGTKIRSMCANDDLVELPLSLLHVDPFYQRGIKERHVNEIKLGYDKRLLSPPIVAKRRRDGTYWVIDGQQRTEALRGLGYTSVKVQLIDVANVIEEAELFVRINGSAKALTTRDNFKACVFRQTNVAVAIESILNKRGLTCLMSDGRNEISAVAKLLESWGEKVKVFQHYDLNNADQLQQYTEGVRVLDWVVDSLMPLVNRGCDPKSVFNGAIVAALVWIARTNSTTSLAKTKKAIQKVETTADLRFIITRVKTSTGGSRRDLGGVRLAYWMNQQQAKPFVALAREEWMLLPLNNHPVDVDNDPAVLIK